MSKQHPGLRRRFLVAAVAAAIGCAGYASAAVPAGGSFATLAKATQLRSGDIARSAVPLNKPIRVSVVLKLRDDAGMKAFLARPAVTRGVMAQAQLQNHLPTQAQAQAVADYLKGAGFSGVKISGSRMIVSATGNAAAVQAAFKTPLVNVQTRDGRNAFANSASIQIPAALQGSVQAVLGLQTVHRMQTYARLQTNAEPGVNGHMPTEFADIYNASGLPAASDVDTAVWGWGSMAATVNDLNHFMGVTGLSAGNVAVVCTDYDGFGTGTISTTDPTCQNYDAGEIEWAMDSQSILGMSGGTRSLTFYAAYGGYNESITTSLESIISPPPGIPLAQVINASFGECERYTDINQGGDGSAQADDALFQLGTAQGQTFTVSTGDDGSDECGFGNPLNSASSPASSPWVVAVSGTTLRATTTTWARENVWLDSGGSPSSFERAQPWQAPLTYGPFKGFRGPDVAFDGNPASGELVWFSGRYGQVGGTSLSAPLFAGAWARILQTNPGLGFAAPHLYALPASAFHDVRAGNNHGYIAKPGWDWATGHGSLDVGAAAAALSSD